jgi:hypothetical protein
MLPRQRRDGRFDRYCLTAPDTWKACKVADADDSMLALWLALLYRAAPDQGMPAEWQASADRARHYLDTLRNRRLGVYHVSHNNHAALFMDNVEVYSSLVDVARNQARFGQREAAAQTQAAAEKLASSIQYVFWDNKRARYRSSNLPANPGFYPDVVGQTYPWLAGMPTPQDPQAAWDAWKQRFASAWLGQQYDPHAWGLIALTALKLNDAATATCWLERARDDRSQERWNVLEEAAYQAVEARTAAQAAVNSCSKVVAGQ